MKNVDAKFSKIVDYLQEQEIKTFAQVTQLIHCNGFGLIKKALGLDQTLLDNFINILLDSIESLRNASMKEKIYFKSTIWGKLHNFV
jgi:hypothetical protein